MDSDAAIAKAYEELGADAAPGAFARSIRTSLGLSLKEVAARVGKDTHFTTIAKLETGKMNFTNEWCKELGRALGVPSGVFFLPYDVLNTAKRVPIFVGTFDAMHRNTVAPAHYSSIMSYKDQLFGVAVVGIPDVVSDVVTQEVIFDPENCDLRTGGVFMVADRENPEGFIAIYREYGASKVFITWPVQREFAIFPDEGSMVVFGRAIEVRRSLFSRNG